MSIKNTKNYDFSLIITLPIFCAVKSKPNKHDRTINLKANVIKINVLKTSLPNAKPCVITNPFIRRRNSSKTIDDHFSIGLFNKRCKQKIWSISMLNWEHRFSSICKITKHCFKFLFIQNTKS